MTSPHIAAREPIAVQVKAGESYWWCACGQSKSQPFCDGSHKGSPFSPKEFTSTSDRTLYFCACKHSQHAPLCDGTHKTL
ncbi:Iron-binding zinc finger CDGSH type [Rhizobiales bacterium GAS191]|nr:Iron-binding zinc finger CDGSH type [Rhizobiales bacterium GAS113]SEC18042.1 Iron-binding zinc finger CDGSH type [Rhizobiales bacterium GAS188]SED05549.1 Iron-binding zinc finger CDGSH type [Rhizobiales bacterium GAS191]